jgi:tape measure domain-containing protein
VASPAPTQNVSNAAEQAFERAVTSAARAVDILGRATTQAAESVVRAANAMRPTKPSSGGTASAGTSGSTGVGAGSGGGAPGTAANAGVPGLQAFSTALAQSTAAVGTASQGMGAAMQSAGAAATAFAQAAQRAAAATQAANPRSGGAGGGAGGVGGARGATAAPGGTGGTGGTGGSAGNAAQALARQTQTAASAATRSSATITKGFERIHDSISGVTDRVMNLRTAFVALGAGVALRSLAETGMKFESLTKAMNIVTGDSSVAKQEMARLREETDRLGLVTLSVSDDYLKFLAAIKGSSVDANLAKDAFFGVAQAMSVLGKSEESTSRAMKALSDIASKGQLFAEELKGQLGDQIPGIVNATATAMGYTTDKLFDEMQKGTVSAEKFFSTINQEIRLRFPVDVMDSARASVNKLTNAWDAFKALMANSGFLDAWADGADKLAQKLNSIEGKVLAQELGETLAKAVRATADAMVWLADNSDKVKNALIAIVAIQAIGWFAGLASKVLVLADAFKILWGVMGLSAFGRVFRLIGLVGTALGAGALAAQYFGDNAKEASKEVQGAENAIDSYNEKLKSGKKITDDMAEAQRDLAIEMTKTALAAEQSKLDEMQGQRKQLIDIAAPDKPKEWKDQAVAGQVLDTGPQGSFKGDEVAQEFNRVGEAADKVAGKVDELRQKLAILQDDADIANRQKPKPDTNNKPLLDGSSSKKKKRSTESYFEEQKTELDQQIEAERAIASAYDQGTAAVEKQRKELEILRKVQKLKFEFNPQQVAELEKRIRALSEAQEATQVRASKSGVEEEITKTKELMKARIDGTESLRNQQATEQAIAEAQSKGFESNDRAVKDLANAYDRLAIAKEDSSNSEAVIKFDDEMDAINKMVGAMDLEGIARTRRMAEIQEESRMIQDNMDINNRAAQARIQAAGEAAVADMGMQGKQDLKDGERQIDVIVRQSAAMALLGEARIRENAEIEKTAELQARGADMTDKNTEAIIRQAGESAVLTNRLERQHDALDDLANSGLTFNEQMRSISNDGLNSLEDALVDIITGTKSVKEAFADMAKAIAADLARMAIRQAITIPLAMGLSSMFMGPAMGAATGAPMALGGVYHTGGIVGRESGPTRSLPSSTFAGAPRFHSGKLPANNNMPSKLPGLGGGEMAAVLKKDEGVFTPQQMSALGPAGGSQTVVVSPTINVTQPAGATQEQGASFGKAISRELQGMVDERIQRAFRPGGIRNQSGAGY